LNAPSNWRRRGRPSRRAATSSPGTAGIYWRTTSSWRPSRCRPPLAATMGLVSRAGSLPQLVDKCRAPVSQARCSPSLAQYTIITCTLPTAICEMKV
jgi:hypothetical protein